MRLFFWKWWKFLRPVPGWKDRLRAYRSGQNAWPIPGLPDAPLAFPWPIEWMPHRQHHLDDEKSKDRGFDFDGATCTDSGLMFGPGIGYCCARCGVPLHPAAAGMFMELDPPRCRRCSSRVARVM
jgi:DNA-directed RNA polymerase subunit RPC12/RpoP